MVVSQSRRGKFIDEIRRNIIEADELSKRAAKKEVSEDTKNRREINDIIKREIIRGKSQKEVAEELLSNPKFKRYEGYLRSWVNDQYVKCGSFWQKGKIEDEQERD